MNIWLVLGLIAAGIVTGGLAVFAWIAAVFSSNF